MSTLNLKEGEDAHMTKGGKKWRGKGDGGSEEGEIALR